MSATPSMRSFPDFTGGTVTGAEALYADMGHFGRRPIRLAWFCVVPTVLTVGIQVLTSLLDNRNNNVSLGFEWIHLLGVVIVLLLVLEVRPTKKENH